MATWKLPFADKYVTGEFGTRSKFRIANNLGPHRGVDWARPSGTKIPAVTSGTVSLVKWSNILGWVLVQTGWAEGKTWYIGYSHLLEEPTLKAGDKIKMGQTVGLMGSTGSASSGPHLHATLGSTPKSVFFGKVYDLKAFIKKQIDAESKTAKKKGTAGTAKGATKPLSVKTEPIKTVKKPAAKTTPAKPAPKKTAPKATPKTHKVLKGESYYSIGEKHGIDYKKLQELNKNKLLKPGDIVRLDPGKNVDKTTKRMYTVKSGDSYWKIGKQFGIDYRKLQRINSNKQLNPGDIIKLD